MKKGSFFGVTGNFNLVYIYDVVNCTLPDASLRVPGNLLFGPIVVNNLGWSRGFWEIVESGAPDPSDFLTEHLFKSYRGSGVHKRVDVVDESGAVVFGRRIDTEKLNQSAFGNFNSVDFTIRNILENRGLIPRDA